MNQLRIDSRIVEVGAVRYTPAGLPALDLQLEHESQQGEAGQDRQVRAWLKAVAFGTVAERLARQAIGSDWRFMGFLASPKNGRHVVLHIADFAVVPAEQ